MDIVSQIKAEANHIADCMAFDIVEKARQNLTHSRFLRLRRHQAYATNQREADYLYAVSMYVKYKIGIQRQDRKDGGIDGRNYIPNRRHLETEATKWRNLMDTIEGGYVYHIPRPKS